MSEIVHAKVLVLGGGPGGYVCAIRCGQLGLETVLVEADRLGGTCLIRGCIPSKAIIQRAGEFEHMAAIAAKSAAGISLAAGPTLDLCGLIGWKDSIVNRLNSGVAALLKKASVRVISGWGSFSDAKTLQVETKEGPVTVHAEHVVLATGSRPAELSFLPFGNKVISSSEALDLAQLPSHLLVVGAGYIGLELGIAFRKLGSRVTIIEAQNQILPLYDLDLVSPVAKWLRRHDVTVHLEARAKGLAGETLVIETSDKNEVEIAADQILVTVGRLPNTSGWGLENMAVDLSGRFVRVDARCATSMKNVWAIGDLVGEPMLEHKAAAQGEMVAEIIAGRKRNFEPAAIPAVCFTDPEIVSCGLSPAEAGPDALVAQFPFVANGRALSMDAGEGFVRVVARKDNHRIVGIQAVGEHVSELSGEFSQALAMGAVLEDIAGTIHAHPTLSEALHEASLRGLGHAIHI